MKTEDGGHSQKTEDGGQMTEGSQKTEDGGQMTEGGLAGLPNTPRAAYEAMAGKRPDLLLGPAGSYIGFASEDPANVSPGQAVRCFGIFAADGRPPLLIFVGNTN